jgi:hypothetical protein
VSVLRAEAQSEPRIHQLCVVRHQYVVRDPAVVDPLGGRSGVQVADVFRLAYGVTSGLDPDVRTPDRRQLGCTQQVAGQLVAVRNHGTGRALALPQGCDLDHGELLVLILGRQQRMPFPVLLVPLHEQSRGCR